MQVTMSSLPRLLGASAQLLRPSQGLNRTQWRAAQRQWQRNLSYQSRNRPSIRTAMQLSQPSIRHQSTVQTAASAGFGLMCWIYTGAFVAVVGFGYLYITDTRASVHQWLVVPALRLIHSDAEEAHHAAIGYIKSLYSLGLHPRERINDDQVLGDLSIEVFGHILDNPIGTSAGMDKNAEVPSALLDLGPALVEVGGITPRPQEGNPKPRVFRIPSQNALINRYGLNSEGADHVAMVLRDRVREFAYQNGLGLEAESERMVLDGEADVPPGSLVPGKLLAVQIAKNKTTPDNDINAIAQDYVYCVERLAKYADILVVNVSSPNTPGLRDLQATAPLTAILSAVVSAAKSTDRKTKPAVMVKVSPDEDSDEQMDGIVTAVWNSGVDGVIVGNTTKKRPDPIPKGFILPAVDEKTLTEVGGYSGPQMFNRTLNMVKRYRVKLDQGPPDETLEPSPLKSDSTQTTPSNDSASPDSTTHPNAAQPVESAAPEITQISHQPKIIFATGGITNGDQCLQILNAGASICQVYTAMMYGGVGTITRMKREMREVIGDIGREKEEKK
ncbi:Hypothetical protein R9X50_00270000 [Acrodontium crateriforme]|uniref:Dihydroorotate dehydrogenase (quinone), mitochondrial n=1 Tax=Acrodontium crateriforme TaxID=150365 RepID=A0AAQ3R8R8_9PEZI|nr:Hypothetical protein R9X50_00270000 [Acrodontium crateriforme]